MLYIKFQIQDASKYSDFQKLYAHLLKIRQPGFVLEKEEEPQFDWDTMTPEEVKEALKEIEESCDPNYLELKRYKSLIPDYANAFLEKYLQVDKEALGVLGVSEVLSIWNYLEYSFEVDLDNLEKIKEGLGIVEFSTGNFPFGGMERFLMTLKAFDLVPTECFNGFTIYKFNWITAFAHEAIDLAEETVAYLKKLEQGKSR